LECGGKRSATPLWNKLATSLTSQLNQSAVAAALCRRTPNPLPQRFVINLQILLTIPIPTN
jgi:hypothetical protein